MIRFVVDQTGLYWKIDGVTKIEVPQEENNPLYQEQLLWHQTNDILMEAHDSLIDLNRYKLSIKQQFAEKIDRFVENLTTTVGIPKSEVNNFTTKAQDAINYRERGIQIPSFSPIYHEIGVDGLVGTGETIDEIVDAIIERSQQKAVIEGKAAYIRRTLGWGLETATTKEEVDAVLNSKDAEWDDLFRGFGI